MKQLLPVTLGGKLAVSADHIHMVLGDERHGVRNGRAPQSRVPHGTRNAVHNDGGASVCAHGLNELRASMAVGEAESIADVV